MAKLKTDFDRYWKLAELKQLKREAIRAVNYEKAAKIRDKEREILKQIEMYDGIFLIEFKGCGFEDRYGLRHHNLIELLNFDNNRPEVIEILEKKIKGLIAETINMI